MQILQPVWRQPGWPQLPPGLFPDQARARPPLTQSQPRGSALAPRQAGSPEGGVGSKAAENR